MAFDPLLLVYLVPLLLIWAVLSLRSRRASARAKAVLDDNVEAGLHEPPSLHPVIDPALCLGCGACARACPEKTIIGLIDGKAALIEPTLCVGHGACQQACPTDAISLVFGTATRGVDIPMLSPQFETSVPGIYIAGELGGMGLIRNAIDQGRQAIEAIAEGLGNDPAGDGMLDVVIVGCGPAGIAASLGAMERKLSFVTVDQSTLGGTVAHYPRGKLVMTSPATLPIHGEVTFGEVSKEALLDFWQGIFASTGLEPRFEERVEKIESLGDGFRVRTSKGDYACKRVLLAIGRRGTPRELGVPGESRSKVTYRMIDPEQYAGRRVLVVGGGDSALEAAAEIAEQSGSEVTLSYRGAAYSRARKKNRERIQAAVASGRVIELLESEVRSIEQGEVEIVQEGELRRFANDDVIICAGGVLPTHFLQETGIAMETKFGER